MVFAYNAVSRDPLRQLQREMDRFFRGVIQEVADGGWPWGSRGQPAVNVWEDNDAVNVEMEVPGVKSDQIDIAVVGNELTVKVDRPASAWDGATVHRQERPTGSHSRTLRLPTEVASDRVEASLQNGVLTITLPKAEAAKPRKIQVNTK